MNVPIESFTPLYCFLRRLQAEVRPAEEERLLEEEGLREEEEAQEAEARAQEAQRAEEVQTGTWPCCSVSCSLQTSKTLTALTFFNIHSTSYYRSIYTSLNSCETDQKCKFPRWTTSTHQPTGFGQLQ